MTSSLVSIRDVHVTLGDTDILQGVTGEIARGKITSVIGLNGSGKTTLLRAVLREIPFQGEIRFHCGHNHDQPNPQQVGYVPQKLRVEASLPLTVCDLLSMSMYRRPLFFGVRKTWRKQMEDMLNEVGAPPALLDRPLDKISGGEQQRVLLALALEPRPELLLLDEPAAGIDFKDQERFYHLIARINEERGVTILLVSHDLSVVSQYAHHILCMKDGKIQCQGSPEEILGGNSLKQIFGNETGIFVHKH